MILDMFDQTVAVRCRNLFWTPIVLSETSPNARTKTASGGASKTEVLMCYKPCKRRPGESMLKRKHFFRWNLAWSNWSMRFAGYEGVCLTETLVKMVVDACSHSQSVLLKLYIFARFTEWSRFIWRSLFTKTTQPNPTGPYRTFLRNGSR